MMTARRRRRALQTIRREFARCGYPLDGLADGEIEAALPPGTVEDPTCRLGAKTISRAVRRLPLGSKRWQDGVSSTPETLGVELRKGRERPA
jgi:hypothetical protein